MRLLTGLFFIFLSVASHAQFFKKHPDKNSEFSGPRKTQFLLTVGISQNRFNIKKSNWVQNGVDYNDSLSDISTKPGLGLQLGLGLQSNFSKSLAFRPIMYLSFWESALEYKKYSGTEEIKRAPVSLIASLPLLYKMNLNKTSILYIGAGPALSFLLSKDKDETYDKLPLRKTDIGLEILAGIDIRSQALRCYIIPELKFGTGLNNLRKDAPGLYVNTLQTIKRQTWSFSLIFKD